MQFLSLLNVARRAALTPATIKNGVTTTGIYLYNTSAIQNEVPVTLVFQGWKMHRPYNVAPIIALLIVLL